MVRTRSSNRLSNESGTNAEEPMESLEQQQETSTVAAASTATKSKRGRSSTTPTKKENGSSPPKKQQQKNGASSSAASSGKKDEDDEGESKKDTSMEKSTEEENVVDESSTKNKDVAVEEPKKKDDGEEEPKEEEEDDGEEKPKYTKKDLPQAVELLRVGKRNRIIGNIVEARDALSRACEMFVDIFGIHDRKIAEAHYNYGLVLLDLGRREPDVVAAAVSGTCLDKIDEEEQAEGDEKEEDKGADLIDDNGVGEGDKMTKEEIRESVLDALEENAKSLEDAAAKNASGGGEEVEKPSAEAGDATGSAAPTDTGDQSTKKKEENGAAAVEEGEEDGESDKDEAMEEDGEAKEGENAEISNLQLSFEVLDVARVVLEKIECKDDKESQILLGDVHTALGEQGMEDEEFDRAASDLNNALGVFKKWLESDDRRIATTYYQVGTLYNLQEKYDTSIENFRLAIDVMKMRVNNLTEEMTKGGDMMDKEKKAELERDIKELEALIVDVQARIQDCVESREEAEKVQEAKEQEKDADAQGAQNEAKEISNAAHLVRRPMKRVDEAGMEEPSKKAKLDVAEEAGGDENGKKAEEVQE